MTDTEARDALAAALHTSWHDPMDNLVPYCTIPDHYLNWRSQADALLAALDGWTLVPVDTVADAEALTALPDHYSVSQDRGEDHDYRWEVAWDYDYDGAPAHRVTGHTIAAAVRAALGDEP